MPYDKETLLKAAYEILKPHERRGMVTVIFRYELEDYISEDEDDILLEIEEKLIKEGWIHQDMKSRLLTPTDNLLAKFEY